MSAFVIDFSEYFVYKRISSSNDMIFKDAEILIKSLLLSAPDDFESILNNATLLNMIGSKVLKINCFNSPSGKVFTIPSLDQTIEGDIKVMNIAGEIVKLLIESNKNKSIFLNNSTRIVLYNDIISVEQWDEENLQDRVNIIFNTILLFLVRKFKQKA